MMYDFFMSTDCTCNSVSYLCVAAMAIRMKRSAPLIPFFVADHSFLFFITAFKENRSLIFIGRFVKPDLSSSGDQIHEEL